MIGKEKKLIRKISISIVVIILISIGISGYLVNKNETQIIERKIEDNLLNVGQMISMSEVVQKGLYEKDTNKVQHYVINTLEVLTDIEVITVADMKSIRYGHPNKVQLGKKFVGGDETKVIETGESYISISKGTLGKSLRAFTPIYYNNEQVGFVMTGHLYSELLISQRNAMVSLMVYAFFGIVIGGIGAILLAINIKKSLLNLEPEEIVRLYREKNAILSSMREGIIAVDIDGVITEINNSAIKILRLNIGIDEIVGKSIIDILPSNYLIEVMEKGEPIYDKERMLNDTLILSNIAPIMDKDKKIGAIATFNDRTEVMKMAEEITGVKQIVDALRASEHEFLNKLHVILGLVELGNTTEVKEYILKTKNAEEEIQKVLSKNIKNTAISGLLLGKYNRGKELQIKLIIDKHCYLEKEYKNINNEHLVTIIGNLIENSLDAIIKKDNDDGKVSVLIEDEDDDIRIEVMDNGVGIENIELERLVERGYSTKEGSEGTGLYLVNRMVNILNGKINISSDPINGTTFKVIIPKEEENDKSTNS